MKPSVRVAFLLSLTVCLTVSACTSSEEPAPAAAPASGGAAKAAAPQKKQKWSTFEAAGRAYEGAQKACSGCPNATACQEALTTSLRMTTAALQSVEGEDGELDSRAGQAETLKQQFDGLAELSNECLQKAEQPAS